MKRLFVWLLWAVVIAGVCVAGDQILLHKSMDSQIYRAAQSFYKDFRGRIIQLARKDDHRMEAVKENWPPALPAVLQEKITPLLHPEKKPTGYVYSDKSGGLHLTTSLDEVPKEYRATAKPLEK